MQLGLICFCGLGVGERLFFSSLICCLKYRSEISISVFVVSFAIRFEAPNGLSDRGDIAIDDFSLTPECAGRGERRDGITSSRTERETSQYVELVQCGIDLETRQNGNALE